jgi:hypothetical protein
LLRPLRPKPSCLRILAARSSLISTMRARRRSGPSLTRRLKDPTLPFRVRNRHPRQSRSRHRSLPSAWRSAAHSRRREVGQFKAVFQPVFSLLGRTLPPQQRTEAEHDQQHGDCDKGDRIDDGAQYGFSEYRRSLMCPASAVSNSFAMNSITVTVARSPRSSHPHLPPLTTVWTQVRRQGAVCSSSACHHTWRRSDRPIDHNSDRQSSTV